MKSRKAKERRLLALSSKYEHQQQSLKVKVSDHVADLRVGEFVDTGESVSMTVWIISVPTLLPVADMVHVSFPGMSFPDKGSHFAAASVPWERFRDILSDQTEDTEYEPSRVRAYGWPTMEQVAALRSHSLDPLHEHNDPRADEAYQVIRSLISA